MRGIPDNRMTAKKGRPNEFVETEAMPDWAKWHGVEPKPLFWYAMNPDTKIKCTIHKRTLDKKGNRIKE